MIGLILAVTVATQSPRVFTNDICLASELYMLKGERNEIFVHSFLKRWRPYDDFVRFDVPGQRNVFLRRLASVATVTNPVDGAALEVSLVNGDEFETMKTLKPVMRAAVPRVGADDVYAQIIGDSITHGGFYKYALIESGFVPKLHLVGLRKVAEGQYFEGRGGWKLKGYFHVTKGEQESYHGFMQPKGGRYWGSTAFWKMCWRCVRKTQPKGFQPTYSCESYDDCAVRFSEETGFLLKPQVGDFQFDDDAKKMLRYNGSAWTVVDERKLEWSFDYGKYLRMWNVHAPDFLFVYLGFNDFARDLKADFSEWAKMIATVKDSYLKAVPGGKFVIAIPISSTGGDNQAGDFSEYKHAAMWRFREWLIANYDRRGKDGYWLLDGSGLALDNDHGFYFVKPDDPICLPYEKCRPEAGTFGVQWGNPHAYPNYPMMGLPFAAFIQYHRVR